MKRRAAGMGRCTGMLHRHPVMHRYLTDLHFKAEVSLRASFAVTLAFCAYKAALGVLLRSPWLGAAAGYYLILGMARLVLVKKLRHKDAAQDTRLYLICGMLLLALTFALGMISFYTVMRGESIRYPGYMIYGAAFYAFYSLTMAIINVIRYKKLHNPVFMTGKVYALASALVSIFFLQASLLSAFGDGGSWQRAMNAGTGAAVFVLIAVMAIGMMMTGMKAEKA